MIILTIVSLLLPLQVARAVSYNWTWWSGEQEMTRISWPAVKGEYLETSFVGSRYAPGFFVDDLTNSAYIFGGSVPYADVPSPRLTSDVWKCDFSRGQGVSWTWIHGSNQYNGLGLSTGIGDVNNAVYPSARFLFAHFFDKDSRKFYLFGGYGLDFFGNIGPLNDHWSYDVDTNSFVWLGGSNQPGSSSNYTIGVESPSNVVGGLYGTAFAYSHTRKEFFMFGGQSPNGIKNILWRYRPSNNMFTALSGNSSIGASSIVTFGELNPANMPSGRVVGSMLVTDEGTLYVFGGFGFFPRSSSDESLISSSTTELWMYDLNHKMWALLSGSRYAKDNGVFSNDPTTAYPSSRYFFNLFHDSVNNIALFQGGKALGHNEVTEYSDEWIFNLTSHQWTYIRGHDMNLELPTYGSYRVSNSDNRPGFRSGSTIFSTDEEFFMFGGATLGDMWKLSILREGASKTTSTSITLSTTTTFTPDYSTMVLETTTESSENPFTTTTTMLASTLSAEQTFAVSTAVATTTMSYALPETTQTTASNSVSTTTVITSVSATTEMSTKERESPTPTSFPSTIDTVPPLMLTTISYIATSSDIATTQTDGRTQDHTMTPSTSKESFKTEVNLEQQRSLEPGAVAAISVVTVLLFLLFLGVVGFYMYKNHKEYFISFGASNSNSTTILATRSNPTNLPTFVTEETEKGYPA